MAKAYFSRKVPFYLVDGANLSDTDQFDAYPVEADPVALANLRALRRMVKMMEDLFESNSAPETSAQQEADVLVAEVRRLFKSVAQYND